MDNRGSRRKLLLLGAGALACIAAYIFVGVGSDPGYVIPRRAAKVLAIVVTGGAVALSTVAFQTVTNNRILTPSIIGLDSLYVLIQTLVVFVFGATKFALVDATVHFAISVGLMVVFAGALYRLLFKRRTYNVYFVLLVGLISGVLFQSLSSFLQMLIDPNDFLVVQGRMFAGFNSVQNELLVVAAASVVVIAAYSRRLVKYLDVLALGKDHAVNLGVDYNSVVRRLWVVIAILVSIATALVGPITFLGLLVVNVAHELFRTHRHATLIAGSVLLSIVTLIGASFVVERLFTFSTTVSVMIDFVGSVYFLYLVLKESQS